MNEQPSSQERVCPTQQDCFRQLSLHYPAIRKCSLASFSYIVYDYGRLNDMSAREAAVYGAILAIAIVFSLMPFSKLIKIGYFVIIPWLFGKTEQLDQDVADAKATANEALEMAIKALKIAIEAKKVAEDNQFQPMTEQEVTDLVNSVFRQP
jgi:hypothetical protein